MQAVLWLHGQAVVASPLLPPAVGVPDNALIGTAVAEPPTPEGALFENPAGLSGFETTSQSIGIGAGFATERVAASLPPGYDHSNNPIAVVPSGGAVVPLGERTRLAVGAYGNVGATFLFPAVAPLGASDFFAESTVASVPLAVAYRLTQQLWVGVEVAPLFGYLRNRFPLPDPSSGTVAAVRYTLRGPGVQGMLGATLRPTDRWTFGLGVRPPGIVFQSGSTVLAGARLPVDLQLQMPTQVFAGATWHALPRIDVSAALRWTQASRFGQSDIEFGSVAIPFVPAAQNEWRVGLGAAVEATGAIVLRGGVSYASHIVGTNGMSPLVFDTDDVKIAAGLEWRLGPWRLHAMGGYQFAEERTVSPSEALILPGQYSTEGAIALLGVMYVR